MSIASQGPDPKHTSKLYYFILAKLPFNPEDDYHMRLLLRIYSILRGKDQVVASNNISEVDWESIGFQNGDNVASDFRGTGVLGLLNILYFVERRCTSYQDIRKIYQLSIDEK